MKVTLAPEPTNRHDPDAVAAFVGRTQVGYLRREVAGALADGCAAHGLRVPTFVVAGVLRGGSNDDVRIGCHVWLDRRVSPGPSIVLEDDGWAVPWPPSKWELPFACF